MAFRASQYTNKKQETKVQLSMSLEEAKKVASGDKDTVKALQDTLKKLATS